MILTMGSITPLITANSSINIYNLISSGPKVFNDQQLVQVEVSRWTENNEIVTSLEFWTKKKLERFQKAMNSAGDAQSFSIMQQYGLILQSKTQDEFEIFLADQYDQSRRDFKQNRNLILTIHKVLTTFRGNYHSSEGCDIELGFINSPFICFRIPGLVYYIYSNNGGELFYHGDGITFDQSGEELFLMTMEKFIGIFIPPIKNRINIFPRAFTGWASKIEVKIR